MLKFRSQSVMLLAAGALLLILLGMSLSSLELAGGYLITPTQEPASSGTLPPIANTDIFMILIYGFLALGIIFLPFYIIQSLSSKEGRKRLLADLIVIMVLTAILEITNRLERVEVLEEAIETAPAPAASLNTTIEALGGLPLPDLPEKAPSWLTVLILVVIAMIIGGGVWLLSRSRRKLETPLNRLAEEAQAALDALQQGEDLRSVILRAYAEMNRAVKTGLGYERRKAMTARDFETALQQRGLPVGALHTLTRLFEQARYSTSAASPEDEKAAITCLEEIISVVTALTEAQK